MEGSGFSPQPAAASAARAAVPSTSGRSRRLPASASELTAGTVTNQAESAEFDLDQGTSGHPVLEVPGAAPKVVENPSDHLAALGPVRDRVGGRRQVRLGAALQVKGELGVRQQIRVPVTGARRTAQEGPAVVAV